MARKLNSHPERCPETPATPTSKQHVECRHLGPQVDGSGQEVEGGCILLHGQVDEAQVVENLPIKGSQVVGPLQAADGLHTDNVVTSVCMHTNTPVCLHTNIVVTPVIPTHKYCCYTCLPTHKYCCYTCLPTHKYCCYTCLPAPLFLRLSAYTQILLLHLSACTQILLLHLSACTQILLHLSACTQILLLDLSACTQILLITCLTPSCLWEVPTRTAIPEGTEL